MPAAQASDFKANTRGVRKRIRVLEGGLSSTPPTSTTCAGSPTRVSPGTSAATFWQSGNPDTGQYIGEKPQLCFGGRSIFWSGLIRAIQGWGLEFFPLEPLPVAASAGLVRRRVIREANPKWMDRLRDSRFPAVAGWHQTLQFHFQ